MHMTQANRPMCKESCAVLRSPENTRYFSKKTSSYFPKKRLQYII